MAESNRPAWRGLHAVIGGWMLGNSLRRRQLASYIDRVEAALGEGGTLLDVGAGNGAVAVEIARRARKATVIAVDVSEQMLAGLRARAWRAGVSERIETRIADAASTGLDGHSVDVVTCTYLLHELPDPAAAVKEMRRVLRPGGKLFIRDFAPSRSFGLMNLFFRFHSKDAHGPLGEEELRAALGPLSSLRIERGGSQYIVSCENCARED